jgi:hypothetical protein
MKMTSNGKNLNYKVVDLVERYNFQIKFTSIQVQTKNYNFLKKDWTPTVVEHGGRKVLQYHAPPTVVGHGCRSLPPSHMALDV